jgi:hypothetical protein
VSPRCLSNASDIFPMSLTCQTSSESVGNLLIFTPLCCKPYLHAHSHCCFVLCSPTYMSLCCTPFAFNPTAPPLLKPQPLVFEGPVRSSFWALQAGNQDRDWSHILTHPEKTGPNHKQLVQVGCAQLRNRSKPVLNQDRSQISPDQFPTGHRSVQTSSQPVWTGLWYR